MACPAAGGNLALCLIACPHNAQLDQMLVPFCDVVAELSQSDDEKLIIVVEERDKREKSH